MEEPRGVWNELQGTRSFYLTGCFINVIKHGRVLWLHIMADLHSSGENGEDRQRKGEELRETRERKVRLTRTQDWQDELR